MDENSFITLLNRTPIEHRCSRSEVVDLCKEWLIHRGGFGKFVPALVNVYTDLRDTGHDHPTAKSWSISIIQAVIDRESTKKESKPKEDLIRLIRDE